MERQSAAVRRPGNPGSAGVARDHDVLRGLRVVDRSRGNAAAVDHRRRIDLRARLGGRYCDLRYRPDLHPPVVARRALHRDVLKISS